MDELIERKISNLIQTQFPAFYNEEGPVFIEFVKAYYEWMEEEGKPLFYTRQFMNYRDIDDTIESFLYYFQKKYLYGIPFDVIINKRLLLKHVLDVYRSKSSLQCFKLLFKLIYNEDMELYLPGRDVIRSSDGTWKEPKYIEVSSSTLSGNMVGKKVKGISSGTTGIVESYIEEPINKTIVGLLYLSNISPRGGSFDIGEKVIEERYLTDSTANLTSVYAQSPSVIGSFDSLEILNGGQNFKVGDLLKVAHRRPSNNEIISFGVEGIVKVTGVTFGRGQINFSIDDPGFGYREGSRSSVYRNASDFLGQGANFEVGTITNIEVITYNTDLVADYLDVLIGANTYGFPGDPSANLDSLVGDSLSYSTDSFGSIGSLTNIVTGYDYTAAPDVFVRDSILSNTLSGNISYSSATNVITGTGTSFTDFFQNNDSIFIQSNSALSNTIEYHVIQEVSNSTSITLYGAPAKTSTAAAVFRLAPNPIQANFIATEHEFVEANVLGLPFDTSRSVIESVKAINSGKGYIDGESVKLYLYGSMNNPTIITAGQGYANGELLLFAGGDPNLPAIGVIGTNSSGNVTSTTLTYTGSGYQSNPRVYVKTANGSGATFEPTISEFNTDVEVWGRIIKGGVGKGRGYWTTTRGFLNSDKYIHDSYYYQDFSYQINTAVTLSKYRDILYDTFHIAGTELFGKFLLSTTETLSMEVAHESNVEITTI